MIKFNQNVWLKQCIDMNRALRKKAKNNFEKDFLKLMNNVVFGKTIENVRKHIYIKLFSIKANLLYYKVLYRIFISNVNEKTETLMNKPVYLGLSILELSKRRAPRKKIIRSWKIHRIYRKTPVPESLF